MELDGIEELKGVLVLGATNRSDILDPAVLRPGRFDEIIEIPVPNEEDRREVFEVHLRGKPVVPGVDAADLASKADGLSGAEIAGVCHHAALRALRRAVRQETDATNGRPIKLQITNEDLLSSMDDLT